MPRITVEEALTRSQRKAFMRFPMTLYSQSPHYVPPLVSEELAAFSHRSNPSLDHAEAKLFLAYKDGEVAGRLAAILSRTANRKYQSRDLRFGWFDSVNDPRVSGELFDAAEDWARELGMRTLTGPQGFTGLDKIGMLVDGFESLPTIATYYNYPYYADLLGRYGFVKEIDYIEYRLDGFCLKDFPPRATALAEKVKRRRGYRVLEFSTRKELLRWADQVFELLDEAYGDLHGYTPLSTPERDHYIQQYFPYVNKELVKIVVNDRDEAIGFFIAMPSLSDAFRKAKGRLLPFGIIHLWRAMRPGNKILDFYLMGVSKRYRNRGVDLVLASEMHKSAARLGFEEGRANPMLETNMRIHGECKHFERVLHRRRRVYTKAIAPCRPKVIAFPGIGSERANGTNGHSRLRSLVSSVRAVSSRF
ncbi:MAG: hypothetical protein JXQ73_08970 [Phycisphaerae bacterium]|nr:hypothetical protein [Phycisphaerae bacterium]